MIEAQPVYPAGLLFFIAWIYAMMRAQQAPEQALEQVLLLLRLTAIVLEQGILQVFQPVHRLL